jgi:polysaccharide pyruvyl transferase WcaK-like protein
VIPTAPAFFATPATAAKVVRAPAIAILIGGYDGSGNYGDIAQLDAAIALFKRFEPELLLLPVLERAHLAEHRNLAGEFLEPPAQALFFDPDGISDDGLLPVPAPADLTFAACYLYGGGYLNSSWGERKLAMLGGAEDLLAAGGCERICRLSSGLQVEADWIADLSAADAEALRSFEPLGVRDRGSAAALAALGSSTATLDTGDDAVGVLRRLPAPASPPGPDGRLHLNLHIAEHGWVTERPQAIADFYADFAAELGRRAGLPVLAQPLLAYLDRNTSEQAALERLAAACAEGGVDLAEARVLRPAGLVEAVAEMRRASITLSCSYHVALTSLSSGVPAILLRDNAYYEQKAAGLAETFGLPPAFALDSSADPRAAAAELAAILLDERHGLDLARRLGSAAGRLQERRAEVETDLVTGLGTAVASALTARLGELSERLRERSAEPAELLAQLSALQTQDEAGGTTPDAPAPSPEDSAAEETLAAVLGSRSWRLTAPLRRVGGLRVPWRK